MIVSALRKRATGMRAVVPFKNGTYMLAPGVLAEGGGRVLRLGMATLDFGAEAGEG